MITLFSAAILDAMLLTAFDLGAPAGADSAHVERDAGGVPTAWRVFAFGPISITRDSDSAPLTGTFAPEHAEAIVANYARKGTKIPLDSRHFTFRLAQNMGVDESDVVELLHSDKATFGFAALEARADGLWIVDAEYHPLARKLLAEGVLRYFSPALRGLSGGPEALKLTSCTFSNRPATDGLRAIAAEADESACHWQDIDSLAASLDALSASAISRTPGKRKDTHRMDKLLAKLAALLGMDTIALSEDGAAPDDVVTAVETLAGELTTLRTAQEAQTAFLAGVRGPLALAADAPLNLVEGAVRALAEKAQTADGLKTRVDALALEGETRKKQELLDRGLAEGKLTADLVDTWAGKQDSAALEAFLEHAPRVVPVGDQVNRKTLPGDTLALTADEKTIAAECGVSEEDMLATKTRLAAA